MNAAKRACTLAAFLLASIGHAPVIAQDADRYPSRPVTLVVSYAAGGPADIIARQLATGLGQIWKQPVVVENRAGASGLLALGHLAQARADGYTLGLMVSPVTAIAPLTQPSFKYDVTKDFTAVADLVDYSLVMLVGPQVKATSVADIIAAAKVRPGSISYGSSGVGGTNHLAGELLSRAAGVEMLHVPYKGNAPAVNAVMSGEVTFAFAQQDSALAFAQPGSRLTPIAVAASTRLKVLPEVPTLAESGLTGMEIGGWTGVLGPANLPPEVLKKIVEGIEQVKRTPEFRARMDAMGFPITPTSSTAFANRIRTERDFWRKKITDGKIALE